MTAAPTDDVVPPGGPSQHSPMTTDLVKAHRSASRNSAGLIGRVRRHATMAAGAVLLGLVVLAGVLAPVLSAYDPLKPSFSQRLAPPWGFGGTAAHVLGTDNLGRDILARLLYGARVSLALAASAVVIAGVFGVVVGLIASWGGERTDAVVMRVADIQLAFPVIMLAIAIVAVVGTNPIALVGVLALSGWVLYARTVRAHVLTIRRLEYIEAAHTLGASDLRIVLRHVLPNTVAPILVIGSSQFATMVLLESGLSFLGMGVQAPRPSWGLMLAEGRDYLSNAWWLATAPGVMISLVVLGANLLGDGLRDLLDPHMG